ncbi:hypothetical protein ACFQ9X_24775 [Catenulispora yoronensis]
MSVRPRIRLLSLFLTAILMVAAALGMSTARASSGPSSASSSRASSSAAPAAPPARSRCS